MTDSIIAEIVTFRTLPGHSAASVAAAAQRLEPFLAARPGFIRRTLSLGADGTWTEHVLWSSLAEAKSAGAQIMADPSAAPFMAMIDGPSARLSHDTVMVRQTAEAA